MSDIDSTQDLSGRVVNSQFRLLRKLGRGGMGVVYLAEQIGMDRQVVVKVLHAELVAGSDTAGARFQREAKAVARLNHPHIVQVHVFGQMETGQPFLAMEYVEGQTLTDLMIGAGRLPEGRALRIVEQVCDALVEAHGAGLVHRDLKPDNIMLADRHGNRDYVKVLDFGLAKMVDTEERAGVTHDGAIFGTPRYMSPEQGRGEKVDARTDLYALGVVLYELLSGVHPFEARSTLDILMKHASAPVVLPSARFPDLTLQPRVEAILKTCLAKDPADRFQSAAELRRVAREALRDLPDYARAAPTPAGPVAHRAKARRWVPAAVLVGSFALTLGIIALVSGPEDPSADAGATAAAPKDAGALTAPHAADAARAPGADAAPKRAALDAGVRLDATVRPPRALDAGRRLDATGAARVDAARRLDGGLARDVAPPVRTVTALAAEGPTPDVAPRAPTLDDGGLTADVRPPVEAVDHVADAAAPAPEGPPLKAGAPLEGLPRPANSTLLYTSPQAVAIRVTDPAQEVLAFYLAHLPEAFGPVTRMPNGVQINDPKAPYTFVSFSRDATGDLLVIGMRNALVEPPAPKQTDAFGVTLMPGSREMFRGPTMVTATVKGSAEQVFDYYAGRYGKLPGVQVFRHDGNDPPTMALMGQKAEVGWKMVSVNRYDAGGEDVWMVAVMGKSP